MPSRCIVKGCPSVKGSGQPSYHRLPNSITAGHLRTLWLKHANRDESETRVCRDEGMCGNHFDETAFACKNRGQKEKGRTKLRLNAVPTRNSAAELIRTAKHKRSSAATGSDSSDEESDSDGERSPELLTCVYCEEDGIVKTFASIGGRRLHYRGKHADRLSTIRAKPVKCNCDESGCDFAGANRLTLMKHLRTTHVLPQFKPFRLTLPSEAVFDLWRKQLTATTGAGKFSMNPVKNQTCKAYSCSGCSPKRKSRLPDPRPIKCMAHLKAVIRSDFTVNVTGCLAHYGHNPETDFFTKDKARKNLQYSTVAVDPATIYCSGAFPTLERTVPMEGEDRYQLETYFPLQTQSGEKSRDTPVIWQYIPAPLSDEQQENLSETTNILMSVIGRIGAEKSERAIHELGQVKKLIESFGRPCQVAKPAKRRSKGEKRRNSSDLDDNGMPAEDAAVTSKKRPKNSLERKTDLLSSYVFTPRVTSLLPGMEDDSTLPGPPNYPNMPSRVPAPRKVSSKPSTISFKLENLKKRVQLDSCAYSDAMTLSEKLQNIKKLQQSLSSAGGSVETNSSPPPYDPLQVTSGTKMLYAMSPANLSAFIKRSSTTTVSTFTVQVGPQVSVVSKEQALTSDLPASLMNLDPDITGIKEPLSDGPYGSFLPS